MTRPATDAPVLALDVDGTSGDYHAHFTWFISMWLGREMPDSSAYTGGVPFHKWLGVSRQTYNDAKLAYRHGGIKRWMPEEPGIGWFTHWVRNHGIQVWICTTRPYLSLDNIDPDLRHWLRRVGIQHDGLLYGPHKYRDLVKRVGVERVLCVIDDLPKMIDQATALGVPAYLRTRPYNEQDVGYQRVESMIDYQTAVMTEMRKRNG